MLHIIERWKIWFVISALVIIPGVYGIFAWGLNYGIDFKGGTLLEMQFTGSDNIDAEVVKEVLDSKEIVGSQVSLTSDNSFLARTHMIDNAKLQELEDGLKEKIGEGKILRYESVGPTISKDLARKAVTALILAVLMIIVYIAWAFRGIPKPLSSWKFGLAAIFALVHDILITVGIFSILGHFKGVEVDNLFITALLTILGFSVHDTIVVFDRIRENLKTTSGGLLEIINKSISETTARSLNTSATVLFTLIALLLFGGTSIFWFIFALVVGVTVGTYSSIFIASVVVYLWHKKVKI